MFGTINFDDVHAFTLNLSNLDYVMVHQVEGGKSVFVTLVCSGADAAHLEKPNRGRGHCEFILQGVPDGLPLEFIREAVREQLNALKEGGQYAITVVKMATENWRQRRE